MKKALFDQIKICLCGLCLVLTGCSTIGLARDASFESAYENQTQEEPIDIYLSEGTAVICQVDEEAREITVFLTDRKEERTFQYNGGSTISDSYGNPMSMAQLKPGDIADIAYNSELERVGRIILSADAWNRQDIEKYTLNLKNGSVAIGEEVFSLTDQTKAFSGGQAISLNEILRNDVLTFRGKGSNVFSITVEKGHGYLDLVGEEGFLGGWIEVGQTVISQIEEDMLITVPEGAYTVRLTSAGVEETRDITILRSRETVLDLSDVEFPRQEIGRVSFEILPEDATVYVDEKQIDTAYILKLPLGLHLVTAKAPGYDTLSEYFQVEEEKTVVRMILSESSDGSENDVEKEEEKDKEKEKATVTIDVPQEVEVYQDNLYKGMAPVTYEKTAGTHTITLRKTGYITRSYEIQVPDDELDMTYTFQALDPENGSQNSISGNSLSAAPSDDRKADENADDKKTVSGNFVSENTVSGNSAEDDTEKETRFPKTAEIR